MAGIKLLLLVIICTTLTIQSVDGKVMGNINDWRNTCCPDCPAVTPLIEGRDRNRYALICQMGTKGNRNAADPFYATLFDKVNKIPVFSRFNVLLGNCPRLTKFAYEGGLVDEGINGYIYFNSSEMGNLLELKSNEIKQKIMANQAHKMDYEGQYDFQQGHLNPHASFCWSLDSVESTFTYTNVAPQVRGFNGGTWSRVEAALRECNNNHMAVVGVVPSKTFLKNRVNIPSFFWAYAECTNSVAFFLAPNVDNNMIKDYYQITHFNVPRQDLSKLMAAISNSLFSVMNIPLNPTETEKKIKQLLKQLLLQQSQKFRLAQGEESILQKLDCEEWLTANDGLVYECVGNQRTEKQRAKEKKQAKSQKERTKVKKAKQRKPS